jgi:hypothetical protein
MKLGILLASMASLVYTKESVIFKQRPYIVDVPQTEMDRQFMQFADTFNR